MTIRIQNLSINPTAGSFSGIAPGTVVASFKDVFTRPNNANIGNQWAYGYIVGAGGSNNATAQIISNKLRFGDTGAGSSRSYVLPMPLAWISQATVQNQWSEFTVPASSTTTWDAGSCVVFSPNPQAATVNVGFYYLVYNPATGAVAINKAIWNGNLTQPTFTPLSSFGTAVPGDVLRINAVNVSGTWTLTVFKNTISVGSTTDNQLTQGMPAFVIGITGVTTTVDLSEFAAGKL